MSGEPLPSRDPDPGRQPADRGGADPDRRRAHGRAHGRAHRPRHRGGARGHAAVRGRDAGPPGPAAPPAGPGLRAGGNRHPPPRAHRAPRRRGDRGGRGRAGGGPDDLRLGRQVRGPPGARGVRHQPHDRRGRPGVAVRHRRRQAAGRPRHPADPGPRPRWPARGAGAAHGGCAGPPARRHGRGHAPRPGRRHRGGSCAGRAGPRLLLAPVRHRALRAAPAGGGQRPRRDPARGRTLRPRGDGRVRPARRGRRGPVRVPPGGHRPAREAHRHRRQDARADRPPDVRAAGPEGRDAGRRRPRRRGSRVPSRRSWTAGSPRRTSTTASSATWRG